MEKFTPMGSLAASSWVRTSAGKKKEIWIEQSQYNTRRIYEAMMNPGVTKNILKLFFAVCYMWQRRRDQKLSLSWTRAMYLTLLRLGKCDIMYCLSSALNRLWKCDIMYCLSSSALNRLGQNILLERSGENRWKLFLQKVLITFLRHFLFAVGWEEWVMLGGTGSGLRAACGGQGLLEDSLFETCSTPHQRCWMAFLRAGVHNVPSALSAPSVKISLKSSSSLTKRCWMVFLRAGALLWRSGGLVEWLALPTGG